MAASQACNMIASRGFLRRSIAARTGLDFGAVIFDPIQKGLILFAGENVAHLGTDLTRMSRSATMIALVQRTLGTGDNILVRISNDRFGTQRIQTPARVRIRPQVGQECELVVLIECRQRYQLGDILGSQLVVASRIRTANVQYIGFHDFLCQISFHAIFAELVSTHENGSFVGLDVIDADRTLERLVRVESRPGSGQEHTDRGSVHGGCAQSSAVHAIGPSRGVAAYHQRGAQLLHLCHGQNHTGHRVADVCRIPVRRLLVVLAAAAALLAAAVHVGRRRRGRNAGSLF
mmetsp:Transcript_30838/g.77415  ORF Transcript_30838/g.77415 Transcript_30838/m.77415 type:complete len:290 (+) Transcript_30838:628-1497(+)